MKGRFIGLAALIANGGFADQALAQRMNRSEFSGGGGAGFGSVAYVGTKQNDRYKTLVQVLGDCDKFAKGKEHNFLINHYKPEMEGKEGYFLVHVILFKSQASSQQSEYVNLYRNEDWLEKKTEFEENMTDGREIHSFFAAHADGKLTEIPEKYRSWHAAASAGTASSFELSRNEVKPFDKPQHQQRHKFMLLKATPTSLVGSEKIPPFYFNASDSDLGLIRVSSPVFGLQPVNYWISFGPACS